MTKFEDFNPLEQINWLQRYIIVHSYIYYQLNDNFISDHVYDARSKQLVELKERHPKEWRRSQYYRQFGKDYNGATGMGLVESLSDRDMNTINAIVNGMYISRRDYTPRNKGE